MPLKINVFPLEDKTDPRGSLVEIFKGSTLGQENWGQVYIVSINPGKTRANHYHQYKNEWFFLAKGQVELTLQDITTQEKSSRLLDGTKPELINIPPGMAHAVKNNSTDEAILVAYIDYEFDAATPDTYSFNLT